LPRENYPALTNAVEFAVLDLLLCCMKMVCFLQVYSLMPDDRLERKRKGSSWAKIYPLPPCHVSSQVCNPSL